MEYRNFFKKAFGKEAKATFVPFNYQRRLAETGWPELPDIPTGLGQIGCHLCSKLKGKPGHALALGRA